LDDERLSKVTIFSVAVALKRKLEGKAPPLQVPIRVARWFYFQTKVPIWVNFGGP
jgi:hypothetical protein